MANPFLLYFTRQGYEHYFHRNCVLPPRHLCKRSEAIQAAACARIASLRSLVTVKIQCTKISRVKYNGAVSKAESRRHCEEEQRSNRRYMQGLRRSS
ncbi:MAG: hypothetical protein LBJ47_04485 [Tannerella sp.]|nr:hypothetical protein [Tannerella sp.]